MVTPAAAGRATRRASNAVYLVFAAAGFAVASWASRIPQIRAALGVTPGALGLILLCAAAGAAISTPASGLVIGWLGEARTVSVSALTAATGLATVAAGYQAGVAPVAGGLFLFGVGTAAWDVAMNVQGAAVERARGRSIMPRFHASWSIGTVAGAGTGAVMVLAGVPASVHLLAVALAVAVMVPVATRHFLARRPSATPAAAGPAGAVAAAGATAGPGATTAGVAVARRSLAAWTEPRTLLIGLFLLCMAFAEGTGNDWLSLAVIDGYHAAAAAGTATFALFLAAMTTGRWFGPRLIDRYGRVTVLRAGAAVALAGLLLIGFGTALLLAPAGALLMGLGIALGFPVGVSSAADDPHRAAARVSAAVSIGYLAFLFGPPAIGFLSDRVGVQHGIALAGLLLAAAFFLAGATAPLPVPAPVRDA
jgi:fucose permease